MDPTATAPDSAQSPSPNGVTSGSSANEMMARFASMGGDVSGAPAAAIAALPDPSIVPAQQSVVENLPPNPGEPPPVEQPAPGGNDAPVEEGMPQTEKARYKYGELKKKAEEYDALMASKLPAIEREKAELQARLEELQKVDPAEFQRKIEALEKQVAQEEAYKALHDVRQSRTYQAEITEPLNNIGQEIIQLAQRYEIVPEQLCEAVLEENVAERHRKIKSLTEGFDPWDIGVLREAEKATQAIIKKGLSMEQNAAQTRQELKFEEQRQAEIRQQQLQEDFARASREGRKQMLEKFPWLGENQEVQAKVFAAKLAEDPMTKTFHAYAFEAMPHLHEILNQREAEIKALKDELAQRSRLGVRAGATQTNGARQEAAAPAAPQGGTAWERFQAMQRTA